LVKYGSERAAIEVLNVIDNFDRALSVKVTPESMNNFIKGIEMTANELKQALSRLGIQEVNCQGVPFDPFVHEALSSEETSDVPEGHVFRVFKKAYKLHDKVIRPAQVVVAKKPTTN
jgi:molecular chaperone GrpE